MRGASTGERAEVGRDLDLERLPAQLDERPHVVGGGAEQLGEVALGRSMPRSKRLATSIAMIWSTSP
jgi:hypothetical protein